MNNFHSGNIIDLVACFFNSETKINIFTIPKIIFIEPGDFISNFSSYQHKSTSTAVYLMTNFHIHKPKMIPVKKPAFRKKASQISKVAKSIPRGRKTAVASIVY